MSTVRVHLYASFRQKVGGQPMVEVSIEPGQSIAELLTELDVPLEATRIIFCNNRLVEPSHTLAGGESLGVFPAIGGG